MKIKNLFKNRKIIITVAALIAVFGVSVGGTLAILSSVTDEVVNKFSVGTVDTELIEVIDGLSKKPSVKNIGKSDCLVRMRVTISPSEVLDAGMSLDLPGNKWVKIGDYYYYEGIVEPGASTTDLFTTVTLPESWYGQDDNILESEFIPFDIALYQEAVQAVVYDENGTAISADNNGNYDKDKASDIWKAYDNAQ